MKNPLTTFSRRTNSPWQAIEDLENEMERWFGSRSSRMPLTADGVEFIPSSDLQETDKDYVLKVDLPGIKKEDVKT